MKYIIDIEDEPMKGTDGSKVYRAKGFQSLVFDENGLKKLTPLSEHGLEKEAFHVGDELLNCDGETAYVLNPHCGKDEFILLMDNYASPQQIYKHGWIKTGRNNYWLNAQIKLAAKELMKENE